jgi:hypothetical protein
MRKDQEHNTIVRNTTQDKNQQKNMPKKEHTMPKKEQLPRQDSN